MLYIFININRNQYLYNINRINFIMAKEWRVIPLKHYDIYEMHSLEDAIKECVRKGESPPTILFSYIDPPAVSISRRQNLHKDVDVELCKRLGIDIARRDKSGRSVYFDNNYLIISVIGKVSDMAVRLGRVRDVFAYFTRMVTYSLHEILGIPIITESGNDIMVNDKKIGGVATEQRDGITVVHGFLRYDKSWELPLQFLKIDGRHLYPYIDRVKEITTSIRELKGINYQDFYENFSRHLLNGISYFIGDINSNERKLADKYTESYKDKKWIRGTGKEDSRGHCDLFIGNKLKIPELKDLT